MSVKRVFIAFAIEDERMRDLFTGQRVHPRSPFEFVDLSVKEAYETDWTEKVRLRIKGAHGVIALLSKHSSNSSGQKWEIEYARSENKPIYGIWLFKDDYTVLPGVAGNTWTWEGVAAFIDRL